MKRVRGYNFSRPFMGERVPQHVQNIVIRDFCNKNKLNFLLSASEYSMEGSFYILNQILKNINRIDGIVAYSVFQLPENNFDREKILKKIIKKKKLFFFASENFEVKNFDDLKTVQEIWNIKQTLNNSSKPNLKK